MMTVTLDRPWLVADLQRPRRILSFAPHRPGFVTARHVLWREVRNADLTTGFDVSDWFVRELAQQGHAEAVGMLTSRDIGRFVQAEARVEGYEAACLATVGLGNAEAVGSRLPMPPGQGDYGTINILVVITPGLTEAAQIEALSIAAQARTAAIMDCGLRLPDRRYATGTGTDCIAIAADPGGTDFAGLHTAVGEAIGQAVRGAVAQGAAEWLVENAPVSNRLG
ncbi:adenosylcobinamide amidohydrolase [Pseudotabrizicola formosa]|uniref:adenosylcobinamide amidohydrolase n=1 Tax=Pseudotabrizicola formosa TaxID=2030009 RepID=UPI000CD22B92|nr:adenosylcobinamide amidohydrolase [Pseudotabrizicola formosa]